MDNHGTIFPENRFFFDQACARLGVKRGFLIHCVRARWIVPAVPETFELDEDDLARAQLIRELQEDFGANDESIPIILHLVDQLKSMVNREN